MKAAALKTHAWGAPVGGLALLVAWTFTATAQEFGYHEPIGPADGCGLSTDYTACCGAGGQPSPINIVTSAL